MGTNKQARLAQMMAMAAAMGVDIPKMLGEANETGNTVTSDSQEVTPEMQAILDKMKKDRLEALAAAEAKRERRRQRNLKHLAT